MANNVTYMKAAAEKAIGNVKPNKLNKSRMSPHVMAKVTKGNTFRKLISIRGKEWLPACKEANESIIDSKSIQC